MKWHDKAKSNEVFVIKHQRYAEHLPAEPMLLQSISQPIAAARLRTTNMYNISYIPTRGFFMYDDFLLFALQYYLHIIHNISVATRSG